MRDIVEIFISMILNPSVSHFLSTYFAVLNLTIWGVGLDPSYWPWFLNVGDVYRLCNDSTQQKDPNVDF